MVIMSMSTDRRQLTDPDKLSQATQYMDVDLYDQTVDSEISEESFLNGLKDKSVMIFVHGYNSEFQDTAEAYLSMHELTKASYDVTIGHMWPGGKNPLGYHSARCRVTKELDERFANTLRKIARVAKHVDIVAHSMGCRLVLEALAIEDAPAVRLLHLAAAAVDNEKLEPGESYHRSTRQCDRLFVYHSKHDDVLKYGYPAGDFDRALGYKGAEHPEDLPSNVKQINMSQHVKSHGGYKNSLYFGAYIQKAAREANEFTEV